MGHQAKKTTRRPRIPMTQARQAMLVDVATAFTELGYRRATTAEIARRCGVQENVLYRAWPNKEAMFAAAIEHIYDRTIQTWEQMLQQIEPEDQAQAILQYEMAHHGENRLYSIIFAGLTETASPLIHDALQVMYKRFQKYLEQLIKAYHLKNDAAALLNASTTAWAMMGIGMIEQIRRELDLTGRKNHGKLIREIGQLLLGSELSKPKRLRGK